MLFFAALFSVLLANPASAEFPSSTLRLTVEKPDGAYSTVRLHCDPAGGSHPDPMSACAEIAASNGDLGQLQQEPTACTMEFRPVVASARGSWAGQPVWFTREFSNPCTMAAATGSVFAF